MRVGGGKAKGSSWERECGKILSLWLTDNDRPDIFSRNVLSGGAFTVASSKGKQSSRMPGDLMAAHPLAFEFLKRFAVECKHLASLGLENFLFDHNSKSSLSQIIMYADGQARNIGLDYMIIAKQNRREAFVIVSGECGARMLGAARASTRVRPTPPHHLLHRRRIFVMTLSHMVAHIDPNALLGS